MTSKKIGLGASIAGMIGAAALVSNLLSAGTGSAAAAPPAGQAGRNVTLTGRIVDFHCYMTGQMPSADAVKCTADCIRAGVPAGLETSEGLVVLGQGTGGPAKTILAFAHQNVEARGRLFEKGGVRYLDLASITPAGNPEHEEDADEGEEEPGG